MNTSYIGNILLPRELQRAPAGWEEKFIIHLEETPWWEIEDRRERKLVCKRQLLRMWYKTHPGYQIKATRKSREKHPGRAVESVRKYCERYPERVAKARLGFCSIHVGTPREAGGTQYLLAPFKRKRIDTICELYGSLFKMLGWHHWDDLNASMGLWVCFGCNVFAGVVDRGGKDFVKKYIVYKELLDEHYADGEIVEKARLGLPSLRVRIPRVGIVANGVHVGLAAWGKRARPKDDLCELCGSKKSGIYHHWDDLIPGKGLWVCKRCDSFAERLDGFGEAFVGKYLLLKRQEQLRVSCLIEGVK